MVTGTLSLTDRQERLWKKNRENAGNSGGPIVNRCGVVGVVSMTSDASSLFEYIGTVSEQNIGFGISSKTAEKAFGLEINQSTY